MPKLRIASTSLGSVLRTPLDVDTYMGKVVATAMSRIFAVSLIPNHTMNSGTRARKGMVRRVWREESRSSSPILVNPVTTPRVSPAARPISRPMPERVSEVVSASGSCPLPHSSPTARSTSAGEASTSGVSTPVADAAHHRTSRATGPSARTVRAKGRPRAVRSAGRG